MARDLRRLLIAPERLAGSGTLVALESAEHHYLSRVLRLRAGDRFAITDGAGRLWSARLNAAAAAAGVEAVAELEQPLEHPLECQVRPAPALTLAVAMPRRDGEVLARMACELGIDGLRPLQAARSTGGERLRCERLELVLREAVEQCERLWLPALLPLQRATALFEAPLSGVGLLATTRTAGLPLLDQELAALAAPESQLTQRLSGEVTLAIGPEGGWSPDEEATAIRAGWRPVSLGPTILRVSTAAVAGTAGLVRWRLGLTCPSCSSPSP